MGGGEEKNDVSGPMRRMRTSSGAKFPLKNELAHQGQSVDSLGPPAGFRTRRRASSAGEKLHRRRHNKKCHDTPVVHVSETHDYMQVWNPYITEGYRLCASYKDCFISLFYFHNCWFDTITALFNIVHSLILFSYLNRYHLDDEDKFVFGMFFLTAWVHSLPSAAYHLIGCSGKSYIEYIFYQRLDFVFIFVSSIPLSVALGWYTFYTQPLWLMVSVLGVVAMAVKTISVIRQEMTPEKRLNLVGSLVFFYFIPVFYTIVSTVFAYLLPAFAPAQFASGAPVNVTALSFSATPTMWWAIAALASLVMGAYTYGARFPECVIPNFPFSSHSWMHLGVNLAYLSEFFFILNQFWMVKRHPQNLSLLDVVSSS